MSILDFLRGLSEQSQQPTTEGQFRCVDRLRAALRLALKNCPLSVYQVAGEMSHFVRATITAAQIYSWTRNDQESPSPRPSPVEGEEVCERRVTWHIPAEYLPAFCKVTGSDEPLRILGELTGLFVLPGPEALRAEIQRLDEEIRDKQSRKRTRLTFLREMERGR